MSGAIGELARKRLIECYHTHDHSFLCKQEGSYAISF